VRRAFATAIALASALCACSLLFGIDGAEYTGPALAPSPGLEAGPSDRHVVATYDGTALRLYVAGQAIGGSPDARVMTPTVAPFLLGIETTAGTSFFQGSLAEVAVYDHALEPDRILAHVRAAAAE
jgi:hypothetical protein